MFQILINSIDKTSDILFNSFSISDYINQQVDTCSFVCKNFKPNLNEEIEVYYDEDKIYGGVIVKVETQYLKGYVEYTVTCKDYSQYLNRELVSERYLNSTPKEIIDDLISEYAPDFTDTGVESNILEGRVAYYKLDEVSGDAIDSVNGNDGVNTAVTFTTGKKNNGAVFNGTTSQLVTPTINLGGLHSFSCWVQSNGATQVAYARIFETFYATGYYLGVTAGGNEFQCIVNGGGNVIGGTVQNGVWTHLVMTYDGINARLYVNGTLIGSAVATAPTVNLPVYIGGSNGQFWKGMIDEVGIWDRALSQSEISELYNSGNANQFPFGYNIVTQITFNRINMSQCLEALSSLLKYSWYVDSDKDIHFFAENSEPAPFDLTTDGGKHSWDSLKIIQDFSQIRNQIYVIGGEYEAESRSESYVADGTQKQFPLAYKYNTITRVRIVGSADLSVGIDGEDEDTAFDVFWNPAQKYIRFKDSNYPDASDVVEITGLPLFQVFVKVPNVDSIAEYGLYEFKIKDSNLTSRQDAINRGNVELEAYADSIEEGSFTTDTYGLRSGQTIRITVGDTDEDFIIQSVSMRMIDPFNGKWNVKLATVKTIGIIRFLQKYLVIDDNITEGETLLELQQFEDHSESTDDVVALTTHAGQDYYWGDDTVHAYDSNWDFSTWD